MPDASIDPEDEPERLGSNRKFWFRREDGVHCLLKFPHRDFGEHRTEAVIPGSVPRIKWFTSRLESPLSMGHTATS